MAIQMASRPALIASMIGRRGISAGRCWGGASDGECDF